LIVSKKTAFTITCLILALTLIAIAITVMISQISIQNIGTVKTVGLEAYKDEALTEQLSFVDWGLVAPSENKTFPAWIKNAGTTDLKLGMWTDNWNPTNASNYMVLTWNYDDSLVSVDQSVPVVFTLSINTTVTDITDFGFDIWIVGVEK